MERSGSSRREMIERLNAFLERYAQECEIREDPRWRPVKWVGEVPIADAIRMLKEP